MAGGTKPFNAPYGQVGYVTRKSPNVGWEEEQEACEDGVAIQIP